MNLIADAPKAADLAEIERAKGATPIELITATDGQPHSVRAFLSGLRKRGRTVVREARKVGDFS